MGERSSKTHKFMKDGQVVAIHNLVKFCKENNLSRSGFSDLKKGKVKQYKGYTLL